MPPPSHYNWFCVAHTLARIANDIVAVKAAQAGLYRGPRPNSQPNVKETASCTKKRATPVPPESLQNVQLAAQPSSSIGRENPEEKEFPPLLSDLRNEQALAVPTDSPILESPAVQPLGTSAVPSSKIARLFHYGGLALSLAGGTASTFFTQTREGQPSSRMLSEANINRLVDKLSRMRGAALKLGQFMSIQDTHALPLELDQVFRRVQNSAHYMPNWQMEKVMKAALGPNYLSNFHSFKPIPFAAASIGQVHEAQLNAEVSPTGRIEDVVVKIQFPGISQSIESDIGMLKSLLVASTFLPRGLFLDKTIATMQMELKEECDYTREAEAINKFRSHLSASSDRRRFKVPWVWRSSTKDVLVMERLRGTGLGETSIRIAGQSVRNEIGARVLELCLRELFDWHTMQTDPNWSNFQWNNRTQHLQLLDFGATRYYDSSFIEQWYQLLQAAIDEDHERCTNWSLKLGYLTGKESEVMINSHVDSMILLASPFRREVDQPYIFGPGSEWSGITARIRESIPVMLKERLTPPPRETYSLNRKLSGAFLLASRLQARINCKEIWLEMVQKKRSHG